MSVKRSVDLFSGDDFFARELPIYVNRVAEDYRITEHRHDFLEISYVCEGSGSHRIGDRALPVNRGDIFLIPVGVSHVFRPASPSSRSPLIVYNCVVSVEAAAHLLGAIPGGQELAPLLRYTECRRYRDYNGEFHSMLQRLHHEYLARRPGREAALYQGVLGLLLHLYRCDREPAAAAADTPTGSGGVEAVLERLHSRCGESLPARELAALAGVGERQLHRLFTKQTGMPLKAYVQSVRVHEACRLLRTTTRKIGDIASAVGYQDISFFNRLFRQKTGLSPREYRQQAAGLGPGADRGRGLPEPARSPGT